MENKNPNQSTTHRRGFIGSIAAGAAAIGIATIGSPMQLAAEKTSPFNYADDADAWFSKLKGKHRLVIDVPHPNENEMMPFAWSRVFLLTNMATGTAEKDNNVVVIFRHEGLPFAFQDHLWEKYKFGEMFKINDPATKAPATRNPFAAPKADDFKVPGIGPVEIGINQLQQSGVMFCACDVAMTVYSAVVAQGMNGDPAEIKKEWLAGLVPGVQPVPSGIWAVGRAQEHGCAYVFAG